MKKSKIGFEFNNLWCDWEQDYKMVDLFSFGVCCGFEVIILNFRFWVGRQ